MISFKNKKILITGATGGIGNELVKKFLNLGGNIVATGTKAEKLDIIKKKYPNVKIQRFDISEHSRIEEFIDNVVLDLGGLDVLINNAGINMDNLSLRMKDEEWKKVIDINLTSTFLLCKHSIKKMLKNIDLTGFNIQKYSQGDHFAELHSERTSFNTLHRLFAWMTYLNDVDDGGQTNFSHYGIKIKPEIGKTLIWPAEWTHAHTGEILKSGTKYIVTGWIHFPISKTQIQK